MRVPEVDPVGGHAQPLFLLLWWAFLYSRGYKS